MQNQLDPVRPWWQQSVWWTTSPLLLALGIVNGPTAWVFGAGYEGLSLSLAWCGLGLMLAQLFMFALVLGCTTESWLRRLTRAYPVILVLCATAAGGWYLGALWDHRFVEVEVRRDLGGIVLLVVESLVIALFVVAWMSTHYQARFVHMGVTKPPQTPPRWSLRDMLLWTTYTAATLALMRLSDFDDDENIDVCFGGICTAILAWLAAFLSTGTVMECFAHFPPSPRAWNLKYNGLLCGTLVALVALDASGLLFDFEQVLLQMVIVLVAYSAGIAFAIAALEACGWRLLAWAGPGKPPDASGN